MLEEAQFLLDPTLPITKNRATVAKFFNSQLLGFPTCKREGLDYINSFEQYLLSTHYMKGIVLGMVFN